MTFDLTHYLLRRCVVPVVFCGGLTTQVISVGPSFVRSQRSLNPQPRLSSRFPHRDSHSQATLAPLSIRERSWPPHSPFLDPFGRGGSSQARRLRSANALSSTTQKEFEMTSDALAIVECGIGAVNPRLAITSHLAVATSGLPGLVVQQTANSSSTRDAEKMRRYHAADFDDVVIVGFGKASSAMALAAAEVAHEAFPDAGMSGVVIVKDEHATADEVQKLEEIYGVRVREASHPIPDRRSVDGADEILDLVREKANPRTLVLCCISGGGSALFCSPRRDDPPLSLDDLARTNAALLASGMSIDKMNVIRKRLERGKGGQLATAAFPSTLVSLILSDIVGDPLDLIASGPTVPDDESTWTDAWVLAVEHGLVAPVDDTKNDQIQHLPSSVTQVLQRGANGELNDTPKSGHPAFATDDWAGRTILVGSNNRAVMSAAQEAKRRGYHPVVLGDRIEGEAQDVAGVYVAMAQHLCRQRSLTTKDTDFPIGKLPLALIAGGETTVTLTETAGKGGRNQELALAAALRLRAMKIRDVVVASVGTDGTDGPTDAAGAVVDGGTVDRIEAANGETILGWDALRNHNAYNFFDSDTNPTSSALVKTGPTGTNVADICVVLIK